VVLVNTNSSYTGVTNFQAAARRLRQRLQIGQRGRTAASGASSSAASNLVMTAVPSGVIYLGSGDSTDRNYTLAGNANSVYWDSSGTGGAADERHATYTGTAIASRVSSSKAPTRTTIPTRARLLTSGSGAATVTKEGPGTGCSPAQHLHRHHHHSGASSNFPSRGPVITAPPPVDAGDLIVQTGGALVVAVGTGSPHRLCAPAPRPISPRCSATPPTAVLNHSTATTGLEPLQIGFDSTNGSFSTNTHCQHQQRPNAVGVAKSAPIPALNGVQYLYRQHQRLGGHAFRANRGFGPRHRSTLGLEHGSRQCHQRRVPLFTLGTPPRWSAPLPAARPASIRASRTRRSSPIASANRVSPPP